MAVLARWGLIPSWVKDPKEFTLLINARSETAIEKASFRARCAIAAFSCPPPASTSGTVRPRKVERSCRPIGSAQEGGIVCFGGLMETYMSKDGSELDTACILTVGANRAIGEIHDRMPVVIDPENFTRWLDCRHGEPRDIVDLMRPASEDYFEASRSRTLSTSRECRPRAADPRTLDSEKAKAVADKSDDGQMSFFLGENAPQATFGAGFRFSIRAAASTALRPSGR